MNSKRQGVISIFLSRVLYFGVGISYITSLGSNLTLLSFLIGFILGIGLLILILKKDWYNFFQTFLGKVIILSLAFFLINNCLVAFSVLGSNFYLINTPSLLIVIPLFVLILYGISRGLKTTLRLSDILIFTSTMIGILALLSIAKNIKLNNFFPITINNYLNIFKCILSSTFYSISPLLLELCLLKKKEVDKKAIIIGYVIGSFTILLMIICILGIFGGEFALLFRYPEYILLKKVNLFNQFEHLETFLSIIWFNDIIMTSLIAGLVISRVFKGIWLYIISFFHLIFIYGFFITNYQHILLLYHYTFYVLLFLIFSSLLSASIFKKKICP